MLQGHQFWYVEVGIQTLCCHTSYASAAKVTRNSLSVRQSSSTIRECGGSVRANWLEQSGVGPQRRWIRNPFRYFNNSPEVIRPTVMMYVRYPLSLLQVEGLLSQRGIDICHETLRFCWNSFSPLFAAKIRKRRFHSRSYSQWRWHLDEVFVRINGKTHYLWRAVNHEGEVPKIFAT